jgi:DNA-binding transcriptional ArsR family regulator
MASPKRQLFTRDDVKIARYAKAISHPARIEILRMLASGRKLCFNDISAKLPLAGSTVSQHLTELKAAGLLKGHYDPPKVWYVLDPHNWKAARKGLKAISKIKIKDYNPDK